MTDASNPTLLATHFQIQISASNKHVRVIKLVNVCYRVYTEQSSAVNYYYKDGAACSFTIWQMQVQKSQGILYVDGKERPLNPR